MSEELPKEKKRILYQKEYVSDKTDKLAQSMDMMDWRDGQIDIETNIDADHEMAFVFDRHEAKVTMMVFRNKQDMQEELGELIPELQSLDEVDLSYYASSEI